MPASISDLIKQIKKHLPVIPAFAGMTSEGDDEQSQCAYDSPIAASRRLNQLS